jgi:hypothetical protein
LLFLQQNNSDQRLSAAETLVWGEVTGAETAAIPLSICCFSLYLRCDSISDPDSYASQPAGRNFKTEPDYIAPRISAALSNAVWRSLSYDYGIFAVAARGPNTTSRPRFRNNLLIHQQ